MEVEQQPGMDEQDMGQDME
jgi:Ran GTPase-activating protein (RanGAP) involved in mRNA processing and transport